MSPYEEQRKFIDRFGWFKDHVAERPREDVVVWKKPGTGINSVHYVTYGSVLFVCGDLGEAAYLWSQKLDWDFLAGLDCDYFLGKCRASEAGSRFVEWNAKAAQQMLRSYLDNLIEGGHKIDQAEIEDALASIRSKEDWYIYVMGNPPIPELYELSVEVPHLRGVAHWYGLKLALQQLRGRAESPMPAAQATPAPEASA